MAEAGNSLKLADIVLLVVDATEGVLEGRTVAQKLAYFSGVVLGRDLGHQAHYYGPFSRDVEEALTIGVVAGDLEESVERIPNWYGGRDGLKHSYALTDDGHESVEKLKSEYPEEAERIEATINAIAEAMPGLPQKSLSAAAKIYMIVVDQQRTVKLNEIPGLAEHLGWNLTQHQVDRTVDVLRKLELLT